MPISHDLKTIFIHIPKNAGESIEKALGVYGREECLWGTKHVLQHMSLDKLMERGLVTKEEARDYFVFAVVRNPWDKAVSEYYWHQKWNFPIPFSNWVRKLPAMIDNPHPPILQIGHNVPQHQFLSGVDFIVRFENIQHEWAQIQNFLGMHQCPLPRSSETASKDRVPYQEYYNDETRDIIADIYAEDIDRFGYRYLDVEYEPDPKTGW